MKRNSEQRERPNACKLSIGKIGVTYHKTRKIRLWRLVRKTGRERISYGSCTGRKHGRWRTEAIGPCAVGEEHRKFPGPKKAKTHPNKSTRKTIRKKRGKSIGRQMGKDARIAKTIIGGKVRVGERSRTPEKIT